MRFVLALGVAMLWAGASPARVSAQAAIRWREVRTSDGLCLTALDEGAHVPAPGSGVVVAPCDGSYVQRWGFVVGELDARLIGPGLASVTRAGDVVVIGPHHLTTGGAWGEWASPSATHPIMLGSDDGCMTVGAPAVAGEAVRVARCDGSPGQAFRVHESDGSAWSTFSFESALPLAPMEAEVYFDLRTDRLDGRSDDGLRALAQRLTPLLPPVRWLSVEVSAGPDDPSGALAERRARAVARALVRLGLDCRALHPRASVGATSGARVTVARIPRAARTARSADACLAP